MGEEPDYESQKPSERLSGNALPGTPRGRRSERLLSVGEGKCPGCEKQVILTVFRCVYISSRVIKVVLELSSTSKKCTAADNCQSCINRKKCFWCSKEKACKKICFPTSECPASCSFWLNCQVDIFGFLMLLLLVIMVIAFICQFCIYQYYLQRTQVYIGGRPHAVYIPHGGDPVYNE
ncbi:PTTG1IP family member 2 [Ovis canadensis]|uniref:PTTG1IP family member 2 n=1 Tax=Ovis canadensis TaxID=37174 RepID=UPI0037510E0D